MSGYPPPPPNYTGGAQDFIPPSPAYGSAGGFPQPGSGTHLQPPPSYEQQDATAQFSQGYGQQYSSGQHYESNQHYASGQQYPPSQPYQEQMQRNSYQQDQHPYQQQQSFQQQQQQQQQPYGSIMGSDGQTPAGQMTEHPHSGSHLAGGSMAHGALSNQIDRDTAAQIPAISEQIPQEPVAGPYLQFINYNPQQYLWRGSAMVLMHTSIQGAPFITLSDRDGSRQAPSSFIATTEGWNYWRFHFDVTSKPTETRCEYQVHLPNGLQTSQTNQRYHFYVPAQRQQWHWAFHSCNGLSAGSDLDRWGIPHLWKDVLNRHSAGPLHALVGGGDQVYNDAVWKTPALLAWLDIPDHK
ncbi:hypothetical protein WJX84_011346, partial [Apatococcus fuscideae]